MRCLALAQCCQDRGWQCFFLSRCQSDVLESCIRREGFEYVQYNMSHPNNYDYKRTLSLIASFNPEWIVIDGYFFTPDYLQALHETESKILVIDDDNLLPHYPVDIILNTGLDSDKLTYHNHPHTKLLLGPEFSLIRKQFIVQRHEVALSKNVATKILLTMGGSDPDNVTLHIVRALKKIKMEDLFVRIVLGPANLHFKSLKQEIQKSAFSNKRQCPTFRLEKDPNMAECMVWADAAISGAGVTCLELCYMGVPFVSIELAENHQSAAKKIEGFGACLNLGSIEKLNEDIITSTLKTFFYNQKTRHRMSECGRNLIDGKGCERIINCLESLSFNRCSSSIDKKKKNKQD